MTPRLTKAMARAAIDDGAEIEERPSSAPRQDIFPDQSVELAHLKGEVAELRAALADEKKSAENRSQELSEVFKALSENKPMRLKPIRDMDQGSPTYLLVTHYDFVPVTYTRKLN